jgi:predicted P-loop ATPase/GTPase
MRLLVAGADQVDAGKTTFSVGLLSHTGAVGFKPRAGNDYWFDHDDYERATREGRLYGKDAKRLAAASAADVTPEAINPVHRLWRPAPGGGTGVLGREDRAFVCDRAGEQFVLNDAADVPASVENRLPLEAAHRVDGLDALNDAMEALYLPALDALHERIRATDRAVVESYGDIARPLRGLEPDAVAVVEPGRARVYDGERYGRACEVADRSPREGQLERPVESVTAHLDPLAAVDLPALGAAERDDPAAVADAYEVAYDALLAAAVE